MEWRDSPLVSLFLLLILLGGLRPSGFDILFYYPVQKYYMRNQSINRSSKISYSTGDGIVRSLDSYTPAFMGLLCVVVVGRRGHFSFTPIAR